MPKPNKLRPVQRIRPLDPDKQLAPYRPPALKQFDRHMPGQLTLEDMGVIETEDGHALSDG